jgi:hypothetical protein
MTVNRREGDSLTGQCRSFERQPAEAAPYTSIHWELAERKTDLMLRTSLIGGGAIEVPNPVTAFREIHSVGNFLWHNDRRDKNILRG